MRNSIRSTVSTTTTSSGGGAGSQRCVRVVLLNREELTVYPEGKARVVDVFNQVCDHVGLRETEYFGLAQLIEGEYQFVEQEVKLQKLSPKGWKNKSTSGEDRPALTLYLRVQYYVEHVSILKERVTRQQYYLQLKDNLLHHSQLMSEEKCFVLAAYALQADHGSRGTPSDQASHTSYFDPREYFPAWVIAERGAEYIERHVPAIHSDHCGMSRLEASMHFIKDVSLPPHAHNLHFYKLKKRKTDPLGTAWLAITPKGIQIYDELNGFKNVLSSFSWPEIEKLHSDKKKFEIRVEGGTERKFTYYTGSEDRGKYLLALCRDTHKFHMSLQPRLAEMRVLEAEDKRYRESYIYSENQESSWGERNTSLSSSSSSQRSGRLRASNGVKPAPSAMATPLSGGAAALVAAANPVLCGAVGGQEKRVSVISSTSSNTTSGIVSDRLHASLEDSEDEPNTEIMIVSPPAPAASGGSRDSLWTSTPTSLAGLSPIVPATPPCMNSHAPASRSNSNQSQKSLSLPPPHGYTTPLAPRPVDAHLERLIFATPMTVNSNPVYPGFVGQQGVSGPEFSTPIGGGHHVMDNTPPQQQHAEVVSPVDIMKQLYGRSQQPQLPSQLQQLQQHQQELHAAQLQQQHQDYYAAQQDYMTIQQQLDYNDMHYQQNQQLQQNHLVQQAQLQQQHQFQLQPQPQQQQMELEALQAQQQALWLQQQQNLQRKQQIEQLQQKLEQAAQLRATGDASYALQQQSVASQSVSVSASQAPPQYSGLVTQYQTNTSGQNLHVYSIPSTLPASQMATPVSSVARQATTPITTAQYPDTTPISTASYMSSTPIATVTPTTIIQPQPAIPSAVSFQVSTPVSNTTLQMAMPVTKPLPQYSRPLTSQQVALHRQLASANPAPPPYVSKPMMYGSTQSLGPYSIAVPVTQPPPGAISKLSQHPKNHVYENLPAMQKAVNAPHVQPEQRSAHPDTRRRSATVASAVPSAILQALGPPPGGATVTRAKSAVTQRPPDVRAKQQSALNRVMGTELCRAASEDTLDTHRLSTAPSTGSGSQLSLASCPVHGIRNNVVDEIRGLSAGNKNVSLPLLTALCNDTSLMTNKCTCDSPRSSQEPSTPSAVASKRFSYSQPPTSLPQQLLEPGTVMRPVSWHSDNLAALEQHLALKAANGHIQHHTSTPNWRLPQQNGQPHRMLNGTPAMFPSKLSTGGHSPNNSDPGVTLHKASLGLA